MTSTPPSTPIPAGVLTVDGPDAIDHYSIVFEDVIVGRLNAAERARLLSSPRPDGVPDGCIPTGPEAYWQRQDDGRWRVCVAGKTWTRAAYNDDQLREMGVPVPPYQPTPPDPAVGSEVRTGPLGLSDGYADDELLSDDAAENDALVRDVALLALIVGAVGTVTAIVLRRSRRARRAAAAVAAALAIVVTAGCLSDAQLYRLRWCESTDNYRAVSASGTYRGAYQFSRSTWRTVGGVGDPAEAPPAEQDLRARILFEQRGRSPWPVCGRRL